MSPFVDFISNGMVILTFTGLLIVFSLCLGIEWFGTKLFRVETLLPRGLYRTLEKGATEKQKKSPPRLKVIQDPIAYALVLKSLGGKGTIFLSQGLLVSATDEELKRVLVSCLKRLNDFGIVWISFRTLLLLGLWHVIPRTWVKFSKGDSMSPLSAFGFWIFSSLYPWVSSFKMAFVDAQGALCRGLVYLGRQR